MRFKHETYSNIPQNSWKKNYFFLLFPSLRHDKINLKINVLYLQNFQNSVLWNVTKCNTSGYQKSWLSWGNYLKTWWYSQIQNSHWVNQRKVINSELIRPLLRMKRIGWPKSPRVSDFHPKSGQFWYFLASQLLCRLRLPSGANASAKILLILH